MSVAHGGAKVAVCPEQLALGLGKALQSDANAPVVPPEDCREAVAGRALSPPRTASRKTAPDSASRFASMRRRPRSLKMTRVSTWVGPETRRLIGWPPANSSSR